MKKIINPEYTSIIEIEKYANLFVSENNKQFKHLDYSVDSLNFIENIIDQKYDILQKSKDELEKITSYILKTLIKNEECGCICVQENEAKNTYFYQPNCYTDNKIDVKTHLMNRIKNKKAINFNIYKL